MLKSRSSHYCTVCLSDQPQAGWLHPGLELDESGGVWGKGGHPAEDK